MYSPEADTGTERRTLKLTMVNRRGLHARAAAKFVRIADGYGCDIVVSKDGHTVSGRSIMGLLMLAAPHGSSVDVVLEGEDAGPAASEIAALVEDGFGERD
ncbi:MAG: HPr family phosphocarrier protein [Pseudomonadota bacterium]